MDSAIVIYIQEKPNSFGQLSYNELKAKKKTQQQVQGWVKRM